MEFDFQWALEEGTMIWYFQEGFRLSVRVEIEQCGQELNSFEELVKKTVDGKAKAVCQPRSYVCKTNQHCFWGSRPSAAKASTLGQPMKDSRVEEPKKSQELNFPAPQCSDSSETSE